MLEVEASDGVGNRSQRVVRIGSGRQSLPARTTLGENYPNPFNPNTTIPFCLSAKAGSVGGDMEVRLSIYNVAGQLVRRLLCGSLPPGDHRVTWDGRNAVGMPVGSGVYICRLKTRDGVQNRRMTLLK